MKAWLNCRNPSVKYSTATCSASTSNGWIADKTHCASTTASTVQAITSSMEPAANASVPSEVRASPCSKMMRASIGKAVIAMAAPMKSMACVGVVLAENSVVSPEICQAIAMPSAKGAAMPASDTATALRRRERMSSKSNSTPIRNM